MGTDWRERDHDGWKLGDDEWSKEMKPGIERLRVLDKVLVENYEELRKPQTPSSTRVVSHSLRRAGPGWRWSVSVDGDEVDGGWAPSRHVAAIRRNKALKGHGQAVADEGGKR